MSENLDNVVIDGKIINLNTASMENLKEILTTLNDNEKTIKQEIDRMLNQLV